MNNINDLCLSLGLKNYEIIDGVVNVNGDVKLYDKGLTNIPIQFGIVTGNFDCSWNKLKSLKGSPIKVLRNFDCNGNKLTSLEGGPVEVGGSYYCSRNKLTSLEGGPKELGVYLDCDVNPINIQYSKYSSYQEYMSNLSIYEIKPLSNIIDDNNVEVSKVSIDDMIGKTIIRVEHEESKKKGIVSIKTSDGNIYIMSTKGSSCDVVDKVRGIDNLLNLPITNIVIEDEDDAGGVWTIYHIYSNNIEMTIWCKCYEEYVRIKKYEYKNSLVS